MPIDRTSTAQLYIRGFGIEIGALHNPAVIPAGASVKYVDRMIVSDLRSHYPELKDFNLVDVDIVDNGENLTAIPDDSQDFVIANHFIEHCQNPIKSIINMLRVIKPGCFVYLVVPDKRECFDFRRPLTTFDHLVGHYVDDPSIKKEDHFYEYAKYVHLKYSDDMPDIDFDLVLKEAQPMIDKDYSIHYHTWIPETFKELLFRMKSDGRILAKFQIELAQESPDEFLFILKK